MSRRDEKKQRKLKTKACSNESNSSETQACGSKTSKSCNTKRCK